MTLLRSFNDGNRLWRWICAIGFEERTPCIPAKGLNRGAFFGVPIIMRIIVYWKILGSMLGSLYVGKLPNDIP